MAEPQGGGIESRAAAHVDENFQERHRNLILDHRRQEQRMLAYHKGQLQSHGQNREQAEQRYVQRMRSIEERRDRIADRLHRQHNSLGGRLEAMTKKGRARQADQLDRLNDRAIQLQGRATRQFNAQTERQFQAEQRDRIFRAREIKFFRLDNLEAREQHRQNHQNSRPAQIEQRAQALKRAAADRQWQQAMEQTRQGRSLSGG